MSQMMKMEIREIDYGEIHSYGFGDSYDVALKIFEEQVTDLG